MKPKRLACMWDLLHFWSFFHQAGGEFLAVSPQLRRRAPVNARSCCLALRLRCLWRLLVLALVLGGVSRSGHAGTLIVTSLADSGPGTLRQCIMDSAAGGTINFSVSGSITLTSGELAIGRDLSIIGPGPKALAISGNHAHRVFNILAQNAEVNISGLTIQNGMAAGTNGAAVSQGDGKAGSPGKGGGITSSSHLSLSNCVVAGNSAIGGTGGHNQQGMGGNGGGALGGGIYSSGPLSLISCLVSSNSAIGGDAGEGMASTGAAGNLAQGGGIYSSGSLLIISCFFSSNSATGGDGAQGLSVGGTGGAGQGGAILNSGSLTMIGSTLCSNLALGGQGAHGGIIDYRFGGGGAGGAIGNQGVLRLTNCTLFGNAASGGNFSAKADGGAIWNAGPGNITSCTLSGNAAIGSDAVSPFALGGSAQGGGVSVTAALTMVNSVVASNAVTGGAGVDPSKGGITRGPDVYGTNVTSQGFNLIGMANDSSGWAPSDQLGWVATPLNPRLGSLQDNGGPTLTMRPMEGSAAIDRGTSYGLATDQRGVARPLDLPPPAYPNAPGSDGSDVGACEVGYTLSLPLVNGGKIFHDPSLLEFNPGSQVRLYAVPVDGWQFSAWTSDAAGNSLPLTVVMDGDKTVTATFVSTVPDMIMDNLDARFSGVWLTGLPVAGHACYGLNYRYTPADHGQETAVYEFDLLSHKTGRYKLYTWYYPSKTNTSNASYQLRYGSAATSTKHYTVNQSVGGGRWLLLDQSVALVGDGLGDAIVTITNDFSYTNHILVADAVKFTWSDQQPLTPWIKSIATDEDHQIIVTWFAEPNTTYRLQFKTNLADAAWIDMLGDITSTGDNASLTNGTTGLTRRFYRVLRLD
jgi:hypothetical protein